MANGDHTTHGDVMTTSSKSARVAMKSGARKLDRAKLETAAITCANNMFERKLATVKDTLAMFNNMLNPSKDIYNIVAPVFRAQQICRILHLNHLDQAKKILALANDSAKGKAAKRSKAQQNAYAAAGMMLKRAMKDAGIANPSAKVKSGKAGADAKRGATNALPETRTAEEKAITKQVSTANVKSIADVNKSFRMTLMTLDALCRPLMKMPGMTEYANIVHEALTKLPKLEAK